MIVAGSRAQGQDVTLSWEATIQPRTRNFCLSEVLHRPQCDLSLHGFVLWRLAVQGFWDWPMQDGLRACPLWPSGPSVSSQLSDGDLQPWHPCPCSSIMSPCTWSGLQLVSLAQPRRRKIPNLRRLRRRTRQSQRQVRAESGVTMLWAVVGRGRGQLRLSSGHWPHRCPAFFLQRDRLGVSNAL